MSCGHVVVHWHHSMRCHDSDICPTATLPLQHGPFSIAASHDGGGAAGMSYDSNASRVDDPGQERCGAYNDDGLGERCCDSCQVSPISGDYVCCDEGALLCLEGDGGYGCCPDGAQQMCTTWLRPVRGEYCNLPMRTE